MATTMSEKVRLLEVESQIALDKLAQRVTAGHLDHVRRVKNLMVRPLLSNSSDFCFSLSVVKKLMVRTLLSSSSASFGLVVCCLDRLVQRVTAGHLDHGCRVTNLMVCAFASPNVCVTYLSCSACTWCQLVMLWCARQWLDWRTLPNQVNRSRSACTCECDVQVRLNTRVETIRVLLEKYLGDDDDLAELHLTGRLCALGP